MVHVPKQKRRKWDSKSHSCILVGFEEETKGYRVYDPNTKQVFKSRDVQFIDEGCHAEQTPHEARNVVRLDMLDTVSLAPDIEDVPATNETEAQGGGSGINPDVGPCVEFQAENDGNINLVSDSDVDEDFEEALSNVSSSSTDTLTDVTVLPPRTTSNPSWSQTLRRSGREHVLPGKYKDFKICSKGLPAFNPSQIRSECDPSQVKPGNTTGGTVLAAQSKRNEYPDDPNTHQEALSREDALKWKKAMQEEFDALKSNDTWSLAELPRGRKAIKCKWVFKTKHDASGNIDRHKARLVIKGFSQRKGVDYEETYSPVVRHSSLRFLFALAAKHDLMIDQMDAITAFLQGSLSEEIYMEQPPMFVDQQNPTMVCRLNKALYGLKQSSRVWNRKLDAMLKKFGLQQAKYDPCVYYRVQNERMLFVAIYVDDVMIFSNDSTWKNETKAFLSTNFRMKYLGAAEHCLGMRISRRSDTICLDQEAYINGLLEKFNMANCKPSKVPMNEKLTKQMSPNTEEEKEEMSHIPYQEAVGSLMYLA